MAGRGGERVAFAVAGVTATATLGLVVLGGLVTNTGAALAVPDWPTTFGRNMFTFPWAEMVGGVLYEHSHRLWGALVGLLTIGLAAALWSRGGLLRTLGLVALAAVVVQGLLGGLRVVWLADALGLVHGCLAQAFFGLLAVLVLLTAPRGRLPVVGLDRAGRGLALVALGLVYGQVVLGAFVTHQGYVLLHLGGALAVYVVVPVACARLRRSGDPVLAPAALGLSVLLVVQLLLGVGSLLARFSAIALPGEQATVLAFPVLHRLVAALLVGAAAVLAVRATLDPARAAASAPGIAAGPAREIAGLAARGVAELTAREVAELTVKP